MLRPKALLHVFCLVAVSAAAASGGASAMAEKPPKSADNAEAGLPLGDGSAFRERMMQWSAAPAPAPESQPVLVRSVPADLPRLSSRFGLRSDPLRGGHARHAGVDIPAPLGTPVLASADGEVRYAGSAGGYGNMIEIEHPGGIRTRYAHLSRILVGERAMVRQGQVIALMGSTGRSTGSHLHFEMRANGAAIDPLPHLGDDVPQRPMMRIAPAEPFVSAFARARQASAQPELVEKGVRP